MKKTKFAIGCIIQWYEVEIYETYIQSVINAIEYSDSKENVTVDICFYLAQNFEQIDEDQMPWEKIVQRFKDTEKLLMSKGIKYNIVYFDEDHKIKPGECNPEVIHTISSYRRKFNEKYCMEADVLMWGESDSLIPKQTFEVLDLLQTNNISQGMHKWIAFFGTCKMWDDSWTSIEHVDFTDKPFIEGDHDNWWSLRYNMNIDEMNSINDKVEELDVRNVSPYKLNGCGMIMSSEVIKCGVNIPRGMMMVHEDTAFQFSLIKNFNGAIPQFVFKNILLVHNRKHPKKRMYTLGEDPDETNPTQKRKKGSDWFEKVWKLDHHNCYNMYNQGKVYTWKDVYDKN